MRLLEGKVAIVTGGARGIGAGVVRQFVDAGCRVAIADILDDDGKALAEECGDRAAYFHHDVADEGSWTDMLTAVIARFGKPGVLVNNAGILRISTLVDCDSVEFERVMRVNLFGTFYGIKRVAPVMIESGKGSIINVSSTEGLRGTNGLGIYGASKWGVRGLTKAAAMELGPLGVRVNSIHPGPTNTPMTNPSGLSGAEINKAYMRQPIQRMAMPKEIATACLFLASDDASYICGAELAVDGGLSVGQYMDTLPGMPAL